jgi:hypothetical protein
VAGNLVQFIEDEQAVLLKTIHSIVHDQDGAG